MMILLNLAKSNVKLKSQHEDFDEDGYDDHSYPIDRRNRFHPNELINSLVSNHNHHNNNCVEEQSETQVDLLYIGNNPF